MQKSGIFSSLTLSKLFIVLCATSVLSTSNAFGAGFCTGGGSQPAAGIPIGGSHLGCSSYGIYKWGDKYVYSCSGCNSGFELRDVTITSNECTNNPGTYKQCVYVSDELSCSSDSECSDMTTDWTAASSGYQTRTYGDCVNGVCKGVKKVRCAAGYYGSSPSCTSGGAMICSGCTQCPLYTDANGKTERTTSSAGTTSEGCCYVESSNNTTFSDTTGSYTFTSDCYKTSTAMACNRSMGFVVPF